MPTIEHFDIPADDVQRAKKFYEELFGWKITKTPMKGVEYWIIETEPAPGKKGLRGGMAKRLKPEQGPMNYVTVNDAAAYARRCEALGGKVVDRSEQVGVGTFVTLQDPEGNLISIWQKGPLPKSKE